MIPLFVGFDQREACCFHALNQSILDHASVPVSITPLHVPMLGDFDGQQDGSNAFIYSRFLVPELMGYRGWAIYCDSDMLFRADPAELWALRDPSKAVMVCRHEYKTRAPRKQIGTEFEAKNEDYPCKNWSSLILWNCGHPLNVILTRQFVAEAGGRQLHRFEWLNDKHVGRLPLYWNWLVGEYEYYANANLVHYTLGAPALPHYRHCDYADDFFAASNRMNHIALARGANREAS